MKAFVRALLAAAALMPVHVSAQEAPASSPVLSAPLTQLAVINFDLLFNQTAFGTWVREQRNAARFALVRENGAYDERFNSEESVLANIKSTLDEQEFNERAANFNARVDDQRRIQDEKLEKIELWVDQQREFFVSVVEELLPYVARQYGLKLVVDSNAVAWHRDSIDLTPEMRAAIDIALAGGNAIANARPAWQFAGIDEAYLE